MSGVSKIMVMMMFVSLLLLLSSLDLEVEGCLEHERFALLRLKPFFNERGILQNWVDDDHHENYSDCCQWTRVTCDGSTGRVIALDLYSTRNWESTEKWYLNASLFTPFQQLEHLDLSENNIAGCVESEGLERLSKLNNLRILYLGNNFFNNTILSSLGGLSSLRKLDLYDNRLEGSIDIKGLTSLSNLKVLDLGDNQIDNLVVPKGLERLSKLNNLKFLDLGHNFFNNTILSSHGGLSSLRELYLDANRLEGSIDIKELESLSNLEQLDMSGNKIEKFIASKGFNRSISPTGLSSLKELYLYANEFKGSFDVEGLTSLSNLEVLGLGFNQIDNLAVPKDYRGLRKLNTLDLSRNNLTNITQGMCELLVQLQELDISRNALTGHLPWCLANMTSLRVLDVSDNQLTGNISSSPLMHLTSIEKLRLSNNHFQIPISLEPFFNHSKLKIFKGGSNEFYAEIDQSHSLAPKFHLNTVNLSGYGNDGTFPKFLYHQRELEQVDLSHMNLKGEFPNWLLENNTNLQTLVLHNNSLSGPLQMPIHSHMEDLDVSNNNFQGNIPAEIGSHLPNLRELNFSRNNFDGSIPSSFGEMKSLGFLDLSNNQLTGEIPEHLVMGCFNLEFLVLSNNNLKGHIFSKYFNLTYLRRLKLDGNRFIGEIPESLSNCSYLGGLYLSDNKLSGKIPTWLGNLSLLGDIIMSNNSLEGPIPTEFCQLHYLQILDLSENNISGSIPSCFSPSSIEQVHLSKNMLQGPLKDGTFYNSSSLVTLDLSYNHLNGSIPHWIERLTRLRYLMFANNNLEGEVPDRLCRLKQLRLIDLSHNNFSEQIPSCLDNTSLHHDESYYDVSIPSFNFGRIPIFRPSMEIEETITFTTKEISYSYKGKPLNNMYGLDISCNKLTGEIPPQIGELHMIHALNLSHNKLKGSIPMTFSSLKQVESLDLSYNNLNGKIPPQLVELNALEVFSVAHNNLSGKIPEPTAQFATFKESSYRGNHFLCGLPLSKSCNENESSPAGTPKVSTSDGEDDSLIDMDNFYVTFTVSYVMVILGIVGVLWVNPYWRRRWFYLVEMWMTYCYYFVLDNLIPTRFYRRCM